MADGIFSSSPAASDSGPIKFRPKWTELIRTADTKKFFPRQNRLIDFDKEVRWFLLLKNVVIYSATRNKDKVLKSVPSMKTVLIS